MKTASLWTPVLFIIALAVMATPALHGYTAVAQTALRLHHGHPEIGKVSYELGRMSTDKTAVSWKVVVSDAGSRLHAQDFRIIFFHANHSPVLEDTVGRVFVPANRTVTVTHRTITDARTANSIRTAEVST